MSETEVNTNDDDLTFERFDNKSSIGDLLFLYKTWQSYNILPDSNAIIPGRRIFVGSIEGDVVFERSVLLSGIIDLAESLISTLCSDFRLIKDLKSFQVNTPFEKKGYLEKIDSIQADIDYIKSVLSDETIVFVSRAERAAEAQEVSPQ